MQKEYNIPKLQIILIKYVSTDATSVRFFLNYPVYCEHRVIPRGATRSKVPTEAVLTVSSYTVVQDYTHYPRNQAAVNALTSQWISLQDEIQVDYAGAESDMHGVLGHPGHSPL